MKNLLKLEELGQLLFSIVLFNNLEYSWWIYIACFLLPDLSMVGYLINSKIGALFYNIFHHKLIAVFIYFIGIYFNISLLVLAGIILFGHSAFDRFFGFGLKFNDDFKNTHLGWIGEHNNFHQKP
nr:DUF4260 domain-containing protein [uncultured Flavobacterium sp.]